MSVSVSAAQLTAMNAWRFRRLARWMARATISLPLPDSPVRRIVASLGPTLATKASTERASGDEPMNSPPPACSSRARFSRSSASRVSSAACAADTR